MSKAVLLLLSATHTKLFWFCSPIVNVVGYSSCTEHFSPVLFSACLQDDRIHDYHEFKLSCTGILSSTISCTPLKKSTLTNSLPNDHAHARMQQESYKGDEYAGKAKPQGQTGGFVAHVLLTKAHVASPGTFHHAHVIYHEEVYLELWSAGTANVFVVCKGKYTIKANPKFIPQLNSSNSILSLSLDKCKA